MPWKKTLETPNLGSEDETDDMRPGLGWIGVAHLQDFVTKGGLLLTVDGHGRLRGHHRVHARTVGRARQRLRIVGSVVRSKMVDATSPIAYGYTDNLAIWCDNGPIFNVSNIFGGARRPAPRAGRWRQPADRTRDGRRSRRAAGAAWRRRPGGAEGRHVAGGAGHRRAAAQRHQHDSAGARPRVILRYADTRDLLVSGLVENGGEIAQHAAVVDVPLEKGHVVAFSNNPIWRGETQGSYFLVFNALLNFDQLDAGRKLDAR